MHFHGYLATAHFDTLISHLSIHDACFGELYLPTRTSVCYLGIFFTPTLFWEIYVSIMALCMRSTLVVLSILGNSIRGLDFTNWRKVFHACILSVLTYSSLIWYTGHKQRGLVHTLQVAQNNTYHKISRCFCTTPTDPLHALLGIPPISYTLASLHTRYITHLERLSPSYPLLTIVTSNPLSCWHSHYHPHTFLTVLVESRNPNAPPFYFSAPPYIPSWSHDHYLPILAIDTTTTMVTHRLIM